MDANTPPPAAPPTADERTWAMLCHLSALCGYLMPVLGWFLGPFLVWQLKKNTMPSIEAHGKAVLNFQLSILLYAIAGCLLIIVAVGIPLLWALSLFNIVCLILAAVKANNGEAWSYPLSLRFLK
ncbi:MAG: DUF4870 domain-containing protein [Opitutae bacterium]|nr:DUF4870 domain-containing protein [Opitutae bacterium]